MNAKFLTFGILTAATLSVGATTYEVSSTWASVSSAGYSEGKGDLTAANGWTVSGDVATVDAQRKIVVSDVAANGALTYTPMAVQNPPAQQEVIVHLDAVNPASLSTRPTGAKAALEAVATTDGNVWYGLTTDGWNPLSGATPSTGAAYDVKMAFDTQSDTRVVRYSVKAADASDWTVLKDGQTEWLACGDETGVSSVAAVGETTLSRIELTQKGTITASSEMAKRMSDQKIAEGDLNKTAANGNPNWENLVLGLDCKDASAKPVVQPVQTAKADKLTLALGGVNVDASAGATVKYRVHAYDADGKKVEVSEVKLPSDNAEMDLPQTGVRYYQMEVVTTPGS